MAEEVSEASVASTSPAVNWWEISTNPMVSWNAMNHDRWPQQTHASDSFENKISISTKSFTNHSSGFRINNSSGAAKGDHTDSHIWNQALLGVGSNIKGIYRSSRDEGENFLDVHSCRNLSTKMFNPACDYLKKLESTWEFLNNSSSPNTVEKQLNSYNGRVLIECERITSNLPDLVSSWSIAPPNARMDHEQISPPTYNISMDPNTMAYTSYVSHMKRETTGSPSFPNFQSYVHEVIAGEQSQQKEIWDFSFCTAGLASQIGPNNSLIGLKNSGLMEDAPWPIPRHLSDAISLSSMNMSFIKGSVSCESINKAGQESNSFTKGSGRGSGTTSEAKNKRSYQYNAETLFKKQKLESSTVSPLKVPKIRVADKITTLQQIVSPFGKTDTASVLLEAIKCIRFLQEQVQLLCDPYLKSGAKKDHSSLGIMERKEKAVSKLDLRSRGLCLVPISCTLQTYRENTSPDNWTPPYRGCLHR